LTAIFGGDLLDDENQTHGFAALCGLHDHKPFECVGEIEESAAVMAHLAGAAEWRDDRVVRHLNSEISSPRQTDPNVFQRLLTARHPHRIPHPFLAKLDACG
jgi:hypothetical protein